MSRSFSLTWILHSRKHPSYGSGWPSRYVIPDALLYHANSACCRIFVRSVDGLFHLSDCPSRIHDYCTIFNTCYPTACSNAATRGIIVQCQNFAILNAEYRNSFVYSRVFNAFDSPSVLTRHIFYIGVRYESARNLRPIRTV